MKERIKAIIGALFSMLGTIEAAIGSTPIKSLDKEEQLQLRLQGNVLQATGSALSADAQEEISFEYIGDVIQSIGNSTVIIGLLLPAEGSIDDRLIIQGNWFQAVGSFTSNLDEVDERNFLTLMNFIGNLLQGIGNSLQAIGGIIQLEDPNSEEGLEIGVVGSWIQALGTVISFLVEIRSE